MMDKYKNKYRIASARAQWWDYGWNGAYFITICTKNREHFFGEIADGKMVLSATGVIADILWHGIPNHAPFVELGDFVVMPNHIHGILILDKPNGGNVDDNAITIVETGHALSLQQPEKSPQPGQSPQSPQSEKSPQSPQPGQFGQLGQTIESRSDPQTIGQKRFQNIGKNTVSSIMGSYKSAVTKHANRLGFENGWQALFHDHIIRDDAEYQRISDYIISNPAHWKEDKFYTK